MSGTRRSPVDWLLSEHLVLALAAVYALAMAPVVPGFATPENARNLASNLLPLLALALGQTFVLIAGGIDLSQTAVVALASVIGASVMTGDGGYLAGSPAAVPAAVAAMLLVGGAVGSVNGAAAAGLGMPPFMATLATMMVGNGLAVWYTRSEKIYDLPEPFVQLGIGSAFGVPYAVPVVAVLALVAHVGLDRTLFGRWLYAVGRNPRAAAVAGVPSVRVVAAAYVLSGVCAAVGSILYTARLETGSPELGQRVLLDVIAAAVLGGTSLAGGRGRVAWTASGVLFITLVDNSLNLMNLSNFAIMMAKGGVILGAALLDAARTRRASRA